MTSLLTSHDGHTKRPRVVGIHPPTDGFSFLDLWIFKELQTNAFCTIGRDAGSEIHLSPTDLASPLPTQVELEQFCKQ